MKKAVLAGLGLALCAGAAVAANVTPGDALQKYCEPLVAGASAKQSADAARQDGFKDEVFMGQPALRQGEMILGVSDAPRVCLVQAPSSMTLEQGFALADAWGSRNPGAVRAPATKGPDGSPVRGWTAPARKVALIASQQTNGLGQKVMTFILMPLPAAPPAGQ